MYEEMYRESLRLDKEVEEACGVDLRVEEVNQLVPELHELIPDLQVHSEQQDLPRLQALLYSLNQDRKRLRAQHFALVCSQALSQDTAASNNVAAELTSLVLALEHEREEKNQLLVLLRIIGKELQRSNVRPETPPIKRREQRATTLKLPRPESASEPVTPRLKRKPAG
jgi:hypothetical protein